jgi:predicted DNA-binding ribbon-helix-helix protein
MPLPKIKSPIAKRSLIIGTRKTSITLETPFWEVLKEIAASETLTPGQLVARIDADRQHANLSSAIRLYVLDHYRRLAEGAAGGGNGGRP